jgi:hypothetical protein
MITSAKYINYIVETINVLRQEIISRNQMGLLDDNIHIENFVCYLLNEIFSYQLINLNSEQRNSPGIDLGDSNKGIGIQVTATKTSAKINSTLKTIFEHKRYEKYPNIKFFVTTFKQETYTLEKSYAEHLKFNINSDVLDFDDLYKRSMYLNITQQKKIADYIHEQIPYVTASIGGDYFSPNTVKRLVQEFQSDSWVNCEGDFDLVIEHNFGYLPQVCVMNLLGEECSVDLKRDEKVVKLRSRINFSGKVLFS